MKISKFLLLAVAATVLAGCGKEEKVDPTLYHLTLSANIELTNEQKNDLKATLGKDHVTVVTETTRDEDEIAELKDAGASDADIAKAGQRQEDGSYYFFDADPLFLEAPQVEGYYVGGWREKGGNKLDYNLRLTYIDWGMFLPRWNMFNRDCEIEVIYEKVSYDLSFRNMAEEKGDSNPNTLKHYCPVDDGFDMFIQPAIPGSHRTFNGWKYLDEFTQQFVDLPLVSGQYKLPTNYEGKTLDIHSDFSTEKFKVSFVFEHYIDSETTQTMDFDDVVVSSSINANLTTINDVPTVAGTKTPFDGDSDIMYEYGSWMNIFFTVKPEYEIWRYKINDGDYDTSYSYYQNIDISSGDITKDSVITIQVSDVLPQ